jgi:hypothetical protein
VVPPGDAGARELYENLPVFGAIVFALYLGNVTGSLGRLEAGRSVERVRLRYGPV